MFHKFREKIYPHNVPLMGIKSAEQEKGVTKKRPRSINKMPAKQRSANTHTHTHTYAEQPFLSIFIFFLFLLAQWAVSACPIPKTPKKPPKIHRKPPETHTKCGKETENYVDWSCCLCLCQRRRRRRRRGFGAAKAEILPSTDFGQFRCEAIKMRKFAKVCLFDSTWKWEDCSRDLKKGKYKKIYNDILF